MAQTTFGVIVGNRGFFPDALAKEGRDTIVKILKKKGITPIILTGRQTKSGAVETYDDAVKCANLFKAHRDDIDGIIVTLPNFGDEKGVANTLRLSELNVPVLVHAWADVPSKMPVMGQRRDSFCGKISVCNNLNQYGIPYTLTSLHTQDPKASSFLDDIDDFERVCRIVKGAQQARIGAIGARPAAFNTVRYSETILENYGVSVETLDLSEFFGQIEKLKDSDAVVRSNLKAIKNYISTKGVPKQALVKMSKLKTVLDRWSAENHLDSVAIQCWTSMEEYFGVVPCTVMSMLSNSLMPNACEVDVLGALSMYVLQLASERPSALVDWNNNYADDPDRCVLFHCSNLPKDVFEDNISMQYQDIIATSVGKENTYGTVFGRMAPSPFTFFRATTDTNSGQITAYVGEGRTTSDPLTTFGGYGVVHIRNLQSLLQHICEGGYEHHVAVNFAKVSESITEACSKYLWWDVYHHMG